MKPMAHYSALALVQIVEHNAAWPDWQDDALAEFYRRDSEYPTSFYAPQLETLFDEIHSFLRMVGVGE